MLWNNTDDHIENEAFKSQDPGVFHSWPGCIMRSPLGLSPSTSSRNPYGRRRLRCDPTTVTGRSCWNGWRMRLGWLGWLALLGGVTNMVNPPGKASNMAGRWTIEIGDVPNKASVNLVQSCFKMDQHGKMQGWQWLLISGEGRLIWETMRVVMHSLIYDDITICQWLHMHNWLWFTCQCIMYVGTCVCVYVCTKYICTMGRGHATYGIPLL